MPLLSLPVLDEAPLTVGDNPSPFGMVNRPPNNVWGDIQSDEQVLEGWNAANPWTFDDAMGDYYGTSVNPHMPPAEGFQGLEGDPRYVEGMGFPAVEGQMLTSVGTYNNDGTYSPPYGNTALVDVEVGRYLRALMKQYKEETGKNLKIESAFRNPSHNEAVGGVPDSGHLKGLSIDIKDPEAREWVKKNGRKYGFELAGYEKKDGTKNKNHFNFGGRSVMVKDFLERRREALREAKRPAPYQQWDEYPMDDDRMTPMERYQFTASPEERTQWGLGDIEHAATINPNRLVRDSRAFQFPPLEYDPDYRQSMYSWEPPSTATEKEREAFRHLATMPKGSITNYIPSGGDPSVVKGLPGSGWTEDTIGTEEDPEWVKHRPFEIWKGSRSNQASSVLGYYRPHSRWGNDEAIPIGEDYPGALKRAQAALGIHAGDVDSKVRGEDPVADQDAAIQFEDQTGMADPHGIYHYASEGLKKMTPPNMTATVRPRAYTSKGISPSGVLQHEALHSVFDDLENAGAKGFGGEDTPLSPFHRKSLYYMYQIGDKSVEESVAYLVDFEKTHEKNGLTTSINITSSVRKAYSDFKQGKITEIELKETLANALSVFDLKEVIEEAALSGAEYMSPEYLAKVKELSYSKLKESIGVDPSSPHHGKDFLKAADAEYMMKQVEKKVENFDFAGSLNKVQGLDDYDKVFYTRSWNDSLRQIGKRWTENWHDVGDYKRKGFETGQERYY